MYYAARGSSLTGARRPRKLSLSPREIGQLFDLRHGKSQSDPAGFKRFNMLGLVEERPGGFAITELGRQRLDAELRAESANRGRPPLFGR